MNRKLLMGGLAGVAAIALAVGGTTYSAWSDFQNVTGNETDAGHLVLNLNGTGAISNVGGMAIAPGQSRTIDQYLTSADLAGVPSADLTVSIQNLLDQENGCTGNSEVVADPNCASATDPGEFSQQSYLRIRYSDPSTSAVFSGGNCQNASLIHSYGYSPANDNNTEDYPSLHDVWAASPISLGTLTAGQGVCVRFDLGLPVSATNASQGDSSTFDLRYDLTQTP